MRRSFDGLALIARQVVGADPRDGALFCFVNRGATRMKVLWWDRNGYCVLYKRLHQAMFEWPRPESGAVSVKIDGPRLAKLLAGVAKKSSQVT
jgi:transposase